MKIQEVDRGKDESQHPYYVKSINKKPSFVHLPFKRKSAFVAGFHFKCLLLFCFFIIAYQISPFQMKKYLITF